MANSTKIRKQAKQLHGRPVCITLHDGRSYVGYISGFEKNALILSRPRPNNGKNTKKSSSVRSRKADVSGFMPLLGSLFGGSGAGAAGGAGFGPFRFFGMIQKAMPVMRMGYGMIKSIRPFLGGLKGLMG